jgi:metallo-beta-lactamase family protein
VAELTFLGAARTVTGSKYLLNHGGSTVLFDCGLFQGLKELRERNWDSFPVDPASVTAVVLTHAHLDHIGYLPRLVAQGFSGRVFCTAGTVDLARLVLPDSGRIQEEDARQANKHGYTKHQPALAPVDEGRGEPGAYGHLHPRVVQSPHRGRPRRLGEFVPNGNLLG